MKKYWYKKHCLPSTANLLLSKTRKMVMFKLFLKLSRGIVKQIIIFVGRHIIMLNKKSNSYKLNKTLKYLLIIKNHCRLLVALVVLLLPLAYAGELEDLIVSQDIVKKHMPHAKQFINEVNANTSKHQLRVQEIIKNSNLNCKKYEKTNWLDQLNLPATPHATFTSIPELYIFVSLSMPQSRLINLLQEAKIYGGILVLRGLKNNSYKDTANFMQPIIKLSQAGVIIDSHLFEKYDVSKVPTFVLNDPSIKKYDKAIGNVSLKYALEEMSRVGDLQSQAQAILGDKQ